MKTKELTKLQKIISNCLSIGFGLVGTLFFVWIIKLLIVSILN